jgi:hypothetical protein
VLLVHEGRQKIIPKRPQGIICLTIR